LLRERGLIGRNARDKLRNDIATVPGSRLAFLDATGCPGLVRRVGPPRSALDEHQTQALRRGGVDLRFDVGLAGGEVHGIVLRWGKALKTDSWVQPVLLLLLVELLAEVVELPNSEM